MNIASAITTVPYTIIATVSHDSRSRSRQIDHIKGLLLFPFQENEKGQQLLHIKHTASSIMYSNYVMEHFISDFLFNGDFNTDYYSSNGCSLILIVALLDEEFREYNNPGFSSMLAAAPDGTPHKHILLNYLLAREDIPRIDKIEALEMAGAILLGSDDNLSLGFQYWRRALALRLMDTDDCRPIYKTPTKSKSGQLSEWSTLEELDQIEKDPAQRVIQSLLVRLRICLRLGWEGFVYHYDSILDDILWKKTPHDCSMLGQILDVCWTTLNAILTSQRPHEECVLESFVEPIQTAIVDHLQTLSKATSGVDLDNLKKCVELLLMTDMPYSIPHQGKLHVPSDHLVNLGHLIEVLSTRQELITEEIEKSLLEIVRCDSRCNYNGDNLLLTSVDYIFSEPSIRFLVELGADPNPRNTESGCGVFHILAEREVDTGISCDARARLMLELGAHLDMVDVEGRTAEDLWKIRSSQYERRDLLPDWLQEGVPKLKCLCARVVRRHKVPLHESNTPAVLIPFVFWH